MASRRGSVGNRITNQGGGRAVGGRDTGVGR
jgi:hypothetical protein